MQERSADADDKGNAPVDQNGFAFMCIKKPQDPMEIDILLPF